MSDIVERLREGIIAPAFEAKRITSSLLAERLVLERREAADTIASLTADNKRLRAAVEAALEDGVGVSYCDDDECGNYVCCGEVSYKPHAPDCWTLKARAALSGDNNDQG